MPPPRMGFDQPVPTAPRTRMPGVSQSVRSDAIERRTHVSTCAATSGCPSKAKATSATARSPARLSQPLPLAPSCLGRGGGAPVGLRRRPPVRAVPGTASRADRAPGALTATSGGRPPRRRRRRLRPCGPGSHPRLQPPAPTLLRQPDHRRPPDPRRVPATRLDEIASTDPGRCGWRGSGRCGGGWAGGAGPPDRHRQRAEPEDDGSEPDQTADDRDQGQDPQDAPAEQEGDDPDGDGCRGCGGR